MVDAELEREKKMSISRVNPRRIMTAATRMKGWVEVTLILLDKLKIRTDVKFSGKCVLQVVIFLNESKNVCLSVCTCVLEFVIVPTRAV